LELHGQLQLDQIPPEILDGQHTGMIVIVPDAEVTDYQWFVNAGGAYLAFEDYALETLHELGLDEDFVIFVNNIEAERARERAMVRLFLTVTYSFIALLTLIGLTNVISTIAGNVHARASEFAVLRSVGMTRGGLNKMLRLESILCSLRSVMWGIPLGLGLSYVLYTTILESAEHTFSMPWNAIWQSALGVFVITWVTMHYAASRLKGKNIVDTLSIK